MAEAVFVLCALTSVAVAALLWRGWRRTRATLLFWTSLGFFGFVVNNVMLVVDEVIVTDRDLHLTRDVSSVVAVAVILFGFIWTTRSSGHD